MKGLPTDYAILHAKTFGLNPETDRDIIQEMWDSAVDVADFNSRVRRWNTAHSLIPPSDDLNLYAQPVERAPENQPESLSADVHYYEFKPDGMVPVPGSAGGELPRTMQIPIHLGNPSPEQFNFGTSVRLVPICRYCKHGEDDHAPDCPGDSVAMLLRIQTLERELRQVKATLEAGK